MDFRMGKALCNEMNHLRKLKTIRTHGAPPPEKPQGGRKLHCQAVCCSTGFPDGLALRSGMDRLRKLKTIRIRILIRSMSHLRNLKVASSSIVKLWAVCLDFSSGGVTKIVYLPAGPFI